MKMSRIMLLMTCVCFSLSNVSCKTAPIENKPVITDTSPSWDGNQQNSGVIQYIDQVGWHITEHAAARYKALSEKYGEMFLPKLKSGEGLEKQEDGTFVLKNEYMVKFILMNKKRKES